MEWNPLNWEGGPWLMFLVTAVVVVAVLTAIGVNWWREVTDPHGKDMDKPRFRMGRVLPVVGSFVALVAMYGFASGWSWQIRTDRQMRQDLAQFTVKTVDPRGQAAVVEYHGCDVLFELDNSNGSWTLRPGPARVLSPVMVENDQLVCTTYETYFASR